MSVDPAIAFGGSADGESLSGAERARDIGARLGNLRIETKGQRIERVAMLFRQLGAALSTGMSYLDATEVIAREIEDGPLSEEVASILASVQEGSSLSAAMSMHPSTFDNRMIAMVRMGEATGHLADMLRGLADNLMKEASFRRKIRVAVLTPAITLVFAIIVLAVALLFIVPTFSSIIAEYKGHMPSLTTFIIGLSNFVQQWWWLLLLLSGGAGFAFRQWVRTESGRLQWHNIRRRTPRIGPRIVVLGAAAGFLRAYATLTGAGITAMDGLPIAAETANDAVLEEMVAEAVALVNNGQTVSGALGYVEALPHLAQRMLSFGEENGRTDEMISHAATVYEEKVDAEVAMIERLIQPFMIAIVGGIVVLVLLALYSPLYTMYLSVSHAGH